MSSPTATAFRILKRQLTTTTTPSIYVAATRQHVGKTTVSLAVMSGLLKRFNKVGFMKPVGQVSRQVVNPDGSITHADKDAALFKDYYHIEHVSWADASPVIINQGYTKKYLDNSLKPNDNHRTFLQQKHKIMSAYQRIASTSDFVLLEGTGHTAVGSIVDANNTAVASWLQASMILVVNGGLGRSLDDLMLNWNMCQTAGVPVAGIIVNQVMPDKYEQTVEYLQKAINHHQWNIPILGCIPDRPFLGYPTLMDLETLLDGTLISGRDEHALRHYKVRRDVHLVACSLEVFLHRLRQQRNYGGSYGAPLPPAQIASMAPSAILASLTPTPTTNTNADSPQSPPPSPQRTLFFCHASRNDILLGFLMEALQHPNQSPSNHLWQSSMVVTGCKAYPLSDQVLEIVAALPNKPPVLLTPHPTDVALEKMYAYVPKLASADTSRVATAIQHYEQHINFDLLLERVEYFAKRRNSQHYTSNTGNFRSIHQNAADQSNNSAQVAADEEFASTPKSARF